MDSRSYFFHESKLTIREGDIIHSKSEVLVSSDDTEFSMGSGVSGSILQAGGKQIYLDASKHIPAKLGDVIVTSAGDLSAKYIFHVVTVNLSDIFDIDGTRMSRGNMDQRNKSSIEIIFDTIQKCFNLMEALGLKTISFPVIGTGTAAFNYKETIIIMASLISYLSKNRFTPFEVDMWLFEFQDRTNNNVTGFLEEIDISLKDENLNLLAESIELANKSSISIFSKIRSLVLKSKFNILEGDIDQAYLNLKSALALAEENNLSDIKKEISVEIEKLSQDFEDWREKIRRTVVFNELLEKLDFQKYIKEAKAISGKTRI